MRWYAYQTPPQNEMEMLHLHLCETTVVHKQKNTQCDVKPYPSRVQVGEINLTLILFSMVKLSSTSVDTWLLKKYTDLHKIPH